MSELSHFDEAGGSRMVDVSAKPVTVRRAIAEARVRATSELLDRVEENRIAKGNLLEVAKLAGIQAAKQTPQLIPLCHPLPLDHVAVEVWIERPFVRIRTTAQATARTGVEMEALTAAAVAALTVIDMGKAVDPGMVVEEIRLIEKTGGSRGRVTPA